MLISHTMQEPLLEHLPYFISVLLQGRVLTATIIPLVKDVTNVYQDLKGIHSIISTAP